MYSSDWLLSDGSHRLYYIGLQHRVGAVHEVPLAALHRVFLVEVQPVTGRHFDQAADPTVLGTYPDLEAAETALRGYVAEHTR